MITPEAIDSVKEALAPVAEALKQGAEFLYEVYFRQTIIEGILSIAIPIVLLVASIVGQYFWYKFCTKKDQEEKDRYEKKEREIEEEKAKSKHGYAPYRYNREPDDGWKVGSWLLGTILIIAVVISAFFSITSGVKQVANPHYYTIDRIINSVKSGEIK